MRHSYTYDAYGRAVSGTGSTENSYRFTGEQFDEELDEYYLRDRYYNAETGRFTRRDVFDGNLAEPLSLQKYIYVHANPVNATDPTGMYQETSLTGETLRRIWEADLRATQFEKAVSVMGLVARVAVQAAEVVARGYIYAQQIPSAVVRFLGIPAIVWGLDLPYTTIHILRAQTGSGYTSHNQKGELFGAMPLPLLLSHGGNNERGWYNSQCPCQGRPSGYWCDEYPYNATWQGGKKNYDAGLVSIQPVPAREQRGTGSQAARLSSFYAGAMVPRGQTTNPLTWFITFANPATPTTYWIDRQGNRQSF
ncbi:MAG: RHS repeat-associated core domain-containing protein [Oculatellaceae cyanobacterium bins.114]|nr:RHS repeat-associated core domain-containing protein [Oculatellaceae cyanobacterium bins.114]